MNAILHAVAAHRAASFALLLALAVNAPSAEPLTLFGFTPFPYDQTMEAVWKTHEIISANSTIYALHFGDPIPWREMLAGEPLPAYIQKKWDDMARKIPQTHKVYVGLAPLDTDRKSLAPAASETGRGPMPAELRNTPLDSPDLKRAYLNYARHAVRQFKPHFLNLGIEAGGVLMDDTERWHQFERLYEYVRSALKQEFPDIQIGISFTLAHLRVEKAAQMAKSLIARSDYVGLSFYPSAAAFSEKFGLPPFGEGADSWRKPLAWVRAYTDKPIALCETGYTTKDSHIPQFKLDIKGDAGLQAAYVKELFEISSRDRYAFVIWFLAIDYDKLYAKMPPGSEVMQLWRNIGLLDGDLHPKPAWEIWKAGVERSRGNVNP